LGWLLCYFVLLGDLFGFFFLLFLISLSTSIVFLGL
jgi:hypothetical protein